MRGQLCGAAVAVWSAGMMMMRWHCITAPRWGHGAQPHYLQLLQWVGEPPTSALALWACRCFCVLTSAWLAS